MYPALFRPACCKGEGIMSNELATWLVSLFLIVPALMYAALVVHDIKKREQKEKKS